MYRLSFFLPPLWHITEASIVGSAQPFQYKHKWHPKVSLGFFFLRQKLYACFCPTQTIPKCFQNCGTLYKEPHGKEKKTRARLTSPPDCRKAHDKTSTSLKSTEGHRQEMTKPAGSFSLLWDGMFHSLTWQPSDNWYSDSCFALPNTGIKISHLLLF